MQSRRILPVEDREMDAIEAHQSAAGADPQVTIPRLGEGLHRLLRQPIGSLPDMPRIARKSVALRHRAGARKRHHPDHGRGPGGNRTYSMHGGAKYTAKQVTPVAPSFRVLGERVGSHELKPTSFNQPRKVGAPHLDFEMWDSTNPNALFNSSRTSRAPSF